MLLWRGQRIYEGSGEKKTGNIQSRKNIAITTNKRRGPDAALIRGIPYN